MFCKYGLVVVSAILGCSCLLAAPAATAATQQSCAKTSRAKTVATKTGHRHLRSVARGVRTAAGFVPPPPAYMPSILPEITARRMQGAPEIAETADDKPVNPYAKYIQTPGGNQPQAIETRKGVVVWNRRS